MSELDKVRDEIVFLRINNLEDDIKDLKNTIRELERMVVILDRRTDK